MPWLTSKIPWIVDGEEGSSSFTRLSHSRPDLLPRRDDDMQLFAPLKKRKESKRKKPSKLKSRRTQNKNIALDAVKKPHRHIFRQSDIKLILYSQHFCSPTAVIFSPVWIPVLFWSNLCWIIISKSAKQAFCLLSLSRTKLRDCIWNSATTFWILMR